MTHTNPLFTALEAVRLSTTRGLMVGLPGRVVAYDSRKQRAQVECGIQQQVTPDETVTIPVITNVPVQFAGSGAWILFHELPVGTEGYIHFSQRATDNWIDQGGPVAPPDARMFSATDAFFVPGFRSLRTVIPDLPADGIGLSNRDGSMRIHLTDDRIVLRAGGEVLELSGAGLKHNGVNIGSTHKHGGVESGGAQTSVPQ